MIKDVCSISSFENRSNHGASLGTLYYSYGKSLGGLAPASQADGCRLRRLLAGALEPFLHWSSAPNKLGFCCPYKGVTVVFDI